MNFNRSWDEYRYGFGHIHSSHWLGLEKIYYLTNSEPKQLLYEANNNKRLFTRQVTDLFRIGNHDSNYTVQIVRNEKGACMSETVGRSFSAFDRDNDDDVGGNCAAIFQSGWWFGSCTHCTMMPGGVWNGSCPSCNPNGPMTKPTGGTHDFINAEIFFRDIDEGSFSNGMWLI
ncbi:angiopoietin-related protein 1-like [Haliotis cracherodii]|uniref:angiopoietin-related protein 1-like n=1 Tax=Haliotis cracherodii TaxID=6455 RepID=UPI0039EA5A11